MSFTLEDIAAKQIPPAEKPVEVKADETGDTETTTVAAKSVPEAKKEPEKPKLPEMKDFAWVVAVPTMPTGFKQVDDLCFKELDDLIPIFQNVTRGGSFGGGAGGFGGADNAEGRKERSLIVYSSQITGDYQIQPIRAIGKVGVTALQEWLEQNDYSPMSELAMKYYAENNWTFLAIKVNAKGMKTGVSQTLHPLRISFRSTYPVLPMKMAEGKVSATFFLMTDMPLPSPKSALSQFGFELQGARAFPRELLDNTKLLDVWNQSALKNKEGAYLYRYQAININPSLFSTDVYYPIDKN